MSVTTTVKKVVTDQTYATIGATDLTVETVRGYTTQLAALRAELEPKKVQARVKSAPADAQAYYADLAKRGEALVTRIRNQKATKDLVGQAESTVALGKGAVTTVKKAVADVERSAKATLTIGRKEAAKAADAVVDSVDVDVKVDTAKAKKAVSTSAKRTTTAAKRTSTTTKKAAARTRTATKSTATAAKTTAAKTAAAADKAADKVGD
jgi:DNA-binding protein HU-beta